MANENAILKIKEEDLDSFNFDDLEEKLQSQLEEGMSELDFLESEKEKINNLETFGETIKGIVWEQFTNQIAVTAGEDFIKENNDMTLDLSYEAHIQTDENFEKGKIATHNTKIDYQKRYDNWEKKFQKDENGSIKMKDGKKVLKKEARESYDERRDKGSASVHKDHTISVAEIIRDPKAAAHLEEEEKIYFANSDVNLKDLEAAANMSKGDKPMEEWLNSKKDGKKPAERFNINEDELKERDKKSNKKFEEIKETGKKKSEETGKKSQKEETFRITGKALRSLVMNLLANLLKEIIRKLIKWFKSGQNNIGSLLSSLKEAISSFMSNMKKHLINAGNSVITTIATAIIGPIVGTIKKAWSVLKQGWKSLKDAINYIKDPQNKEKAIGDLLLEVGKIVIVGFSGIGAIALGEAIEKGLITIPILAINIPLFGSLANILGIFLGAITAGIIGAIAINLIQKVIEKHHMQKIVEKKVDKGNEVLTIQYEILDLSTKKLIDKKKSVSSTIKKEHEEAASIIKDSLNNIFTEKIQSDHQETFDKMDSMLDDLLD